MRLAFVFVLALSGACWASEDATDKKVCYLGYKGHKIIKDEDHQFSALKNCKKGDVVAFGYEKTNYGQLIAAVARICDLSETHVMIEDARKGLVCTYSGQVLPLTRVAE